MIASTITVCAGVVVVGVMLLFTFIYLTSLKNREVNRPLTEMDRLERRNRILLAHKEQLSIALQQAQKREESLELERDHLRTLLEQSYTRQSGQDASQHPGS